MKTSSCAGAFLLGALVLGGCAAAPTQGAQLRMHATTAASVQRVPARDPSSAAAHTRRATHKGSALPAACRGGNSKSCAELGDRLSIKYAYTEAHQWYVIACDRVSNAMVPTATRLMSLSQDFARLGSMHSDDEEANAANQRRLTELKSEASELKARIQGCFDAGESLKLDSERKQSLKFFDTVCEFSTLVEAVGAAVPGLEHVTESGCAAGQTTRARLNSKAEFSPGLFIDLVKSEAAQGATQNDQGMVFNEGDL